MPFLIILLCNNGTNVHPKNLQLLQDATTFKTLQIAATTVLKTEKQKEQKE